MTRTLLEEKYSVDTYDSSPRWIRGNNEYRPSRKFAQTRSRRPSVKNTTYYNKPFRWLQVVGSKTTFSPFQPLSQCSTFLSFPLCMWGTATCVSYFRIAFHGSWNTQPREFQTIRVPVFSFFFFFSAGILGVCRWVTNIGGDGERESNFPKSENLAGVLCRSILIIKDIIR